MHGLAVRLQGRRRVLGHLGTLRMRRSPALTVSQEYCRGCVLPAAAWTQITEGEAQTLFLWVAIHGGVHLMVGVLLTLVPSFSLPTLLLFLPPAFLLSLETSFPFLQVQRSPECTKKRTEVYPNFRNLGLLSLHRSIASPLLRFFASPCFFLFLPSSERVPAK